MPDAPIHGKDLMLLGLLLAFVPSPLGAQVQQHRVGLNAGATASAVNGEFMIGTETKWGFLAGFYGESRLARNFASHLAFNYTQKGGRGLSREGLLDLRIAYLETPLLLQLLAPLGRNWDLAAYSGIALAFPVSCRASVGRSLEQKCKDTSLGDTRVEWGLPMGAGLSYGLDGGQVLFFDARYTWGLGDALEAVDVNNRTWQFLLRYAKRLR